MGIPKSIRLDEQLEEKIEDYLEHNPIKFPQLGAMALEKFISEPNSIELKPVDDAKFLETAKKAFKKHKHAMDKLK